MGKDQSTVQKSHSCLSQWLKTTRAVLRFVFLSLECFEVTFLQGQVSVQAIQLPLPFTVPVPNKHNKLLISNNTTTITSHLLRVTKTLGQPTTEHFLWLCLYHSNFTNHFKHCTKCLFNAGHYKVYGEHVNTLEARVLLFFLFLKPIYGQKKKGRTHSSSVSFSCCLARNRESFLISRSAPLYSRFNLCWSLCFSWNSRLPFLFFFPSNLQIDYKINISSFSSLTTHIKISVNIQFQNIKLKIGVRILQNLHCISKRIFIQC